MHKQLRRFIPFVLPSSEVTQEKLDQIANVINNIPSKILDFRTPAEVQFEGSRVKLARPAMETSFNMKFSSVALRC
jgi:IS30 family transposase